jgi:hypothetical protein
MNELQFIENINIVVQKYIQYGSRSTKKTECLHLFLAQSMKPYLDDTFEIKFEDNIKSANLSGYKRCDITVYHKNELKYIFPVKFVMSNYSQNKNNYWEQITGETKHLKEENKKIQIIPINIIFNYVPYLTKNNIIKKFEKITLDNSYKNYELLKKWGLCSHLITYILDVKHKNKIGEKYTNSPDILMFSQETPFIKFSSIFELNT